MINTAMFRTVAKPLFIAMFIACACAAQVRDPLPVPDIPGYRTLKCDFHMHSVFSDGLVWPAIRVQEAWSQGLDAIAITDHASYTPFKDDVTPDPSRAYVLAERAAAVVGLILIPGVEFTGERDLHFNALFTNETSGMGDLDVKTALTRVRARKAFIFWNHPGWKETPQWFPLVKDLYDSKLLDGMEIVNGLSFYPEAYPWVEGKQLTALANSDVHGLTMIDYPGRTRPITLVFAKTADVEGVREALFARRTAAWMGGQVWGQREHLEALWRRAVELETPELRVKRGASCSLRLRNRSAIPFKLELQDAPEWFRPRMREIAPEKTAALPVTIPKAARPGTVELLLKFSVTNLHTGPGQDLSVDLPVTVVVE